MVLQINKGTVRFTVFLLSGGFIEICKRRGRRPFQLPASQRPILRRTLEEEEEEEERPDEEGTNDLMIQRLRERGQQRQSQQQQQPQCRFCFGTDIDGMCSPCRCSGSAGFVHLQCLRHWQMVSMRNSGTQETRCRVCQCEFRDLPRRSRREEVMEWFAPTAKDRTRQYWTAWRDTLLNTLLPQAADLDCREFNRLAYIVETVLGCEMRVFYSREIQRGNKLFIWLRKCYKRMEQTHLVTFIAMLSGRMLIAGINCLVDEDGIVLRNRHRVQFAIPMVSSLRDILVSLQTPIEALMRFHMPHIYACAIIQRYPQFRINCGAFDRQQQQQQQQQQRRQQSNNGNVFQRFFALGREEAHAISNESAGGINNRGTTRTNITNNNNNNKRQIPKFSGLRGFNTNQQQQRRASA
jgi:hypothetical protein